MSDSEPEDYGFVEHERKIDINNCYFVLKKKYNNITGSGNDYFTIKKRIIFDDTKTKKENEHNQIMFMSMGKKDRDYYSNLKREKSDTLEVISVYSLSKRKKLVKRIINLLKNENLETIQEILYVSSEKSKINKEYGININSKIDLDLDSDIKERKERISKFGKYRLEKFYYVREESKYKLEKLLNILGTDLIYDNEHRIKIIKSLIYQLCITMFYLYMNYGIVHNELKKNNIYIVKSEKDIMKIKVKDIKYRIKLFGFMIKITGFENSMSWDFLDLEDFRDKHYNECRGTIFPISDIDSIINIFDEIDVNIKNTKNFELKMKEKQIYRIYRNTLDIYNEEEEHKKYVDLLKKEYYKVFNDLIIFDNEIIEYDIEE